MHSHGWVHRDLSYCNILVDQEGKVRLIDLEYAKKIEAPSTNDIAYYIHRMGLGSRAGLVVTSQISSDKASASDIRLAFDSVYKFLDSQLTPVEKNLIRFDPIMVEHLLCKYQRIQKNLSKSKKKKN